MEESLTLAQLFELAFDAEPTEVSILALMEGMEFQREWLVVKERMVVCRLCGQTKPKGEFYLRRRRNKTEFVYARCKACLAKYPIEDLYIRDRGMCGLCGDKVPLGMASMDHILPISRGGKHEWDNLQLAHKSCNWKKGSKTMEELKETSEDE